MDKTDNSQPEKPHLFTSDADKCPDFAAILKQSSPDSSLFEQIADCFSDRLAGFARYYCRNDQLGQDAFQDAMLTTLTNLDKFRGDSPLEPWLRRIVVSACSRLRRGRKNSPAVNLPLDENRTSGVLADEVPNQEAAYMMAERLALVKKQIAALDEPNRSLLTLHDIEEHPISEIAKRFELTEEAVKSRLKRSRATVRQGLLDQL
jgi:RNA polymerase sigma factor (sigma-70 family)